MPKKHKSTNGPERAARNAAHLAKADTRRELAIAEVRDGGENFKRSRGAKRGAIVERADRCEIQRERIWKKVTTRSRLRSMSRSEREAAREAGRRQFGEAAPEYHRLRITPQAYEALKKRLPQKTEPFAALKG